MTKTDSDKLNHFFVGLLFAGYSGSEAKSEVDRLKNEILSGISDEEFALRVCRIASFQVLTDRPQ